MSKTKSKVPKNSVDGALRAVKALQMRRDGMTYLEIATNLGVHESTACRDIHKQLKRLNKRNLEEAKYLQDLELERLDGLLHALKGGVAKGDPKSVEVARKLSESRRKMLGLDKPQKIELTDVRDLEARAHAGDKEAAAELQAIAAKGGA